MWIASEEIRIVHLKQLYIGGDGVGGTASENGSFGEVPLLAYHSQGEDKKTGDGPQGHVESDTEAGEEAPEEANSKEKQPSDESQAAGVSTSAKRKRRAVTKFGYASDTDIYYSGASGLGTAQARIDWAHKKGRSFRKKKTNLKRNS